MGLFINHNSLICIEISFGALEHGKSEIYHHRKATARHEQEKVNSSKHDLGKTGGRTWSEPGDFVTCKPRIPARHGKE
jgi:hypothetical protein